MIKSLLYYIALLLFVIYNCNTPFTFIRKFIPSSVGKYLLGFPAFIVVTTILVVYPILTGKELLTFNTDPNTASNIFRSDTSDSVNRATVVIDDSGEIVLEKSADINKKFTDLITSLRNDLNAINSKVNNNSNVLKNQLISLSNATKANLNGLNYHFADAADATSAITPAPLPSSHITCNNSDNNETRSNTKMCKRKTQGDAHKNLITSEWHDIKNCENYGGAAWLTNKKDDTNSGRFACIRNHGTQFVSADKRGAQPLNHPTMNFNDLQTS